MITPTNGRIVWFTPQRDYPASHGERPMKQYDSSQPLAAMIVHVWGDRLVNLVVHGSNGVAWPVTSVTLLQDNDLKPEAGYFAEWMPYQKGQAAKTEQLEAAAAGKSRMNGIGWAVKQLHNGARVRRAGWNGKGMWLCLVTGWNGNFNGPLGATWATLPFVAMRVAGEGERMVPWLCSQTDLLATDWEIAE